MRSRGVTSRDVAERAGVSRSTVSLVLNDVRTISISEATRKRVIDAARDLRYVPHAAGRALVMRRTRNIGLVHSSFASSHGLLIDVIRGLTNVMSRYEHRLLVDIFPPGDDGTDLADLSRAKHIDGLVLFESRIDDPPLKAVVDDGLPVVLIGTVENDRLCSVDLDNRRAARMVTEHLIGLGHRRIGCITHAPREDSAAAARFAGYLDALQAAGIGFDAAVSSEADFHPGSGYVAMGKLLDASGTPPTALFVTNDLVAMGAMKRIRESGLRIPEDIAVAGFDDIPTAAFAAPPLTTLRFSAEEEGRRAGEMLIGLIEGRVEPGRREEIGTELIVRESTVGYGGRFGE